ncbi:MAG: hypothetical protein IPK07_08085 [Deltaproteobacteria bacterium]|nr:hypothetical protein [Deltaproteobacteria bacterium]
MRPSVRRPTLPLALALVLAGAAACRSTPAEEPSEKSAAPKTAEQKAAESRARANKARVHISLGDLRVADPHPGAPPREAVSGPGTELAGDALTAACGAGAIPLPRDKHYAAPGLVACWVGHADGNLRQLAFAPDGDLFGAAASGVIYRFRDADRDGAFAAGAPETIVWADSGGNGNSVHIDATGGYLYASTPDGVRRWRWAPDIDRGGPGEAVIVEQPSGGGHGKHTNHLFEGFLYVQLGSAGNAANPMSPEYDTERSLVKRFDMTKLDPVNPYHWAQGEVFTVGLRNTVGFWRAAPRDACTAWSTASTTSPGVARTCNDNPGEQLVLLEKGKRYGYPFCTTAQRLVGDDGSLVPTGTQVKAEIFPSPHDDAWCAANSERPVTFFQAHSAPLDITFFDGPEGKLPARWKGGAFVSFHGSWDRNPYTGYKVVWVPFDAEGRAPMPVSTATETRFPYEVVLGGGTWKEHADGPWSWEVGKVGENPVRPVGVAVSPLDGSLYVASDAGNMVYRVVKAE